MEGTIKTAGRFMRRLDRFQRRHRPLAFAVAVVKKYGHDDAGQLGALLTYYGFLSLFPLLLVVTTITQVILKNQEHLRSHVLESIGNYFPPVFTDQLEQQVHSLNKVGLAFIIGLAVTFYGAKKGADALQLALNQIWGVPHRQRPDFWRRAARSFGIIVGGGGGLLLAAVLSSYAVVVSHIAILVLLIVLISFTILFASFFIIFRLGISSPLPRKDVYLSSAVAALGVQVLQSLGGFIIARELHGLNALYGAFAIVLGLFFWIYLQAQVFLYAVEIGVVHARKLWPRKLV